MMLKQQNLLMSLKLPKLTTLKHGHFTHYGILLFKYSEEISSASIRLMTSTLAHNKHLATPF